MLSGNLDLAIPLVQQRAREALARGDRQLAERCIQLLRLLSEQPLAGEGVDLAILLPATGPQRGLRHPGWLRSPGRGRSLNSRVVNCARPPTRRHASREASRCVGWPPTAAAHVPSLSLLRHQHRLWRRESGRPWRPPRPPYNSAPERQAALVRRRAVRLRGGRSADVHSRFNAPARWQDDARRCAHRAATTGWPAGCVLQGIHSRRRRPRSSARRPLPGHPPPGGKPARWRLSWADHRSPPPGRSPLRPRSGWLPPRGRRARTPTP
ncbi:MAG: hypothetical protein KatS3mg061_0271 [Dehalococcoidia bacterium]|nr:MAG: hypothetical protein KatS3mg061_0271 [Dehalococcoidia bacterium]